MILGQFCQLMLDIDACIHFDGQGVNHGCPLFFRLKIDES
jgi:hypothetical protein